MASSGPGYSLLVAAVIVLVVIAAFYGGRSLFKDSFTIEQTLPVVSKVDGLRYRVHEGHHGSQEAADTLAALNSRVVSLMRVLRARYILDGARGARYPGRRAAVKRLLTRYNPDNLAENSPADPSGDTSYAVDKGAVVAMCLRSRTDGRHGFHDLETLTFVFLHEMTHIAIEAVQHPPEFWEAFKFILQEAHLSGVYSSPDYAARPAMYCGVRIDYNPALDPSTPSL